MGFLGFGCTFGILSFRSVLLLAGNNTLKDCVVLDFQKPCFPFGKPCVCVLRRESIYDLSVHPLQDLKSVFTNSHLVPQSEAMLLKKKHCRHKTILCFGLFWAPWAGTGTTGPGYSESPVPRSWFLPLASALFCFLRGDTAPRKLGWFRGAS